MSWRNRKKTTRPWIRSRMLGGKFPGSWEGAVSSALWFLHSMSWSHRRTRTPCFIKRRWLGGKCSTSWREVKPFFTVLFSFHQFLSWRNKTSTSTSIRNIRLLSRWHDILFLMKIRAELQRRRFLTCDLITLTGFRFFFLAPGSPMRSGSAG